MPYSCLFPFLTQNFPWAPHSSGLRVSSLPSRCWMLSLLQKTRGTFWLTPPSHSHIPSFSFPHSARARYRPALAKTQNTFESTWSCGAWALGLLASSSKPSSPQKMKKSSISCLKKNYKKETLDRSLLSLIKEITLGGPHVTSWVGIWVGLVVVFCLHIQIHLVEEEYLR